MAVGFQQGAEEHAAAGLKMLVDGRLVPALAGKVYGVESPDTGAKIAEVPDAAEEDVDIAIHAAERASKDWSALSNTARATVVRKMADIAEDHEDDIAALDTMDTGVPFWMMRRDVRTGIRRMRLFADWALRLNGETVPSTKTHLTYTERVPFGIVARIVAYNHPAMFGISKIAAPLVAGNTVVLKPSQHTPLSMLWLGQLWADAVPSGVLGIVVGASAEPGVRLVSDKRVKRIAFTGSVATGRAIQAEACASGVKSVSLELGGKNALIMLGDASPEEVVTGAVKGMNFAFAGQSCGSTSRLIVPLASLDEVIDLLRSKIGRLRMGAPFDSGCDVGPLINSAQFEHVAGCVDEALGKTAQRVSIDDSGAPERGYYYPPTVLVEKDPQSPLATEEVFGPVLTLMGTKTVEESVGIANSVDYGLTASVFGHDIAKTYAVANSLHAGYVWINDTSTHFDGLPFGGVKDSGVGREESFDELVSYTQTKTTSVKHGQ